MEQIEHEMIDELTGEIISADIQDTVVVEDLPKVVRILGALELKEAKIEFYLNAEVDRLKCICEDKLEAIGAEHTKFKQIAERLLRQSGKTKLSYPGLGSVRIGMTRESVDTSGYDELSVYEQQIIQGLRQDFFRTKTTVSPDKKAIMVDLKDNGDTAHFAIRPKQETFVFKAE